MAAFSPHKVVSALPDPLLADSVYFVRVGSGIDMYITNSTGTITAYRPNVDLKIDQKVDAVANTSIGWDSDNLKATFTYGGTAYNTSWPINITGESAHAFTSTYTYSAHRLDEQLPSYYTDIPARLGYTPANVIHQHAAGDVTSGIFNVARIPDLAISKITNLQTTLDAKANSSVVTTSSNGLMIAADKAKLDGIAAGAQVNTVTSVAGKTGAVVLAKGDVGLGNVDNTTDANKPISTATQSALNAKLDLTGGTLTNKLTITPPANTAPICIPVNHLDDIPTNLTYGDMYVHMNKLYVRGYSASFTLGSTGDLPTVTQATAESGTSSAVHAWSPQRVRQNVMAAPIVKQGGTIALEMNHVTGTGITLKAGSTDYGINWPINITGSAGSASNAAMLNGQAASYYTNIPARLGFTPPRQLGTSTIGIYWNGSNVVTRVDSTDFLMLRHEQINTAVVNIGYLGIGAYSFAFYTGTNQINQGDTVAGSSLRWTNAKGGDMRPDWHPGTWRCHGFTNSTAQDGNNNSRVTLWQRIA